MIFSSNPVLEVEGFKPLTALVAVFYLCCELFFLSPCKPLQVLYQLRIQCLDHFQVFCCQGTNEGEEGGAEDEEDEAGEDEQGAALRVPEDARQGGEDEGDQETQGEAEGVFARQDVPEEGEQ